MSEVSVIGKQSRFAPLGALTQQEAQEENTRTFPGDGTNFLKVPGLKKLEGMAILTGQGRVSMPLNETREYLRNTDANSPRDEVEEPFFDLIQDTNGESVLVRSVLSNSGVWQKGVTFLVSGEWSGKKTKNSAKDAEPDESKLPSNPELVDGETLLELKIPGVADEVIDALRLRFPNREAVETAHDDEILAIDGIGPAVLKKIRDAMKN